MKRVLIRHFFAPLRPEFQTGGFPPLSRRRGGREWHSAQAFECIGVPLKALRIDSDFFIVQVISCSEEGFTSEMHLMAKMDQLTLLRVLPHFNQAGVQTGKQILYYAFVPSLFLISDHLVLKIKQCVALR